MAAALMLEGFDISSRYEAEEKFEKIGHEIRAERDENYKRSSWGLRPEDVEAAQGLTGDMTGQNRPRPEPGPRGAASRDITLASGETWQSSVR